jgi:hypothetical protein
MNQVLNFLSKYKILIVSIVAGFFIYFRKLDYYKSIPRYSILTSLIIVLWSYATLKEPWFLVIGLIALNLFGMHHTENELNN